MEGSIKGVQLVRLAVHPVCLANRPGCASVSITECITRIYAGNGVNGAALPILPRNIVFLVVLLRRGDDFDFIDGDGDAAALLTVLGLPTVLMQATFDANLLPLDDVIRETLRTLAEKGTVEEIRVRLLVLAELVARYGKLNARGFPCFLALAISGDVSGNANLVDVAHVEPFLSLHAPFARCFLIREDLDDLVGELLLVLVGHVRNFENRAQ